MCNTLLLGLAITIAAPAPKEGGKADPAAFEGEWKVESYIQGGKPNERRVGTVFQIGEGKVVTVGKNEQINYKLNPKTDPAEIDLTNDKEKILGIYKLDGDTLILCFPKGRAEERPAKLESPADSNIVLMTLKREKKK